MSKRRPPSFSDPSPSQLNTDTFPEKTGPILTGRERCVGTTSVNVQYLSYSSVRHQKFSWMSWRHVRFKHSVNVDLFCVESCFILGHMSEGGGGSKLHRAAVSDSA